MKREKLNVEAAIREGLGLPYAMVRSLSQVTLGPAPAAVDAAELLEARFFDNEQEIRVFHGEDGLEAVRLRGEDTDHTIEETYSIENPGFGGSLTVTRVLDWDGDGQAYTAASRLSGWKEERTDG